MLVKEHTFPSALRWSRGSQVTSGWGENNRIPKTTRMKGTDRTQRALASTVTPPLAQLPPLCPTCLPHLSTPPVIPALASLDLPGIASKGSIPFLNASLVKAAVTTATA